MAERLILSNSFTKGEINLMHSILETLHRGGDVSVLMRNPNFGLFQKKIFRMKQKLDAKLKEKRVNEQSSP